MYAGEAYRLGWKVDAFARKCFDGKYAVVFLCTDPSGHGLPFAEVIAAGRWHRYLHVRTGSMVLQEACIIDASQLARIVENFDRNVWREDLKLRSVVSA